MATYDETDTRIIGGIGPTIRILGQVTVSVRIEGEVADALPVTRILGHIRPAARTLGKILPAGSAGVPGSAALQPGEPGYEIEGGTPATPGVTLE